MRSKYEIDSGSPVLFEIRQSPRRVYLHQPGIYSGVGRPSDAIPPLDPKRECQEYPEGLKDV